MQNFHSVHAETSKQGCFDDKFKLKSTKKKLCFRFHLSSYLDHSIQVNVTYDWCISNDISQQANLK